MNKNEQEIETPVYKASLPEKLALLVFVVLPVIGLLVKQRWNRWLQKHAIWTQKNINTLITINLVLVLFLATMLVVLNIWLSHVRGR